MNSSNHATRQTHIGLLSGRVISVTRSNLSLILEAFHHQVNRSKFSITHFVGRIVTETVQGTDVSCDARKGSTRVRQTRCVERPTARGLCQIVHLSTREIVKFSADRHSFKWTHLAKVSVVLSLRTWNEDLPVTL